MFTGIVEAVGRVAAADAVGKGRRLTIEAPFASELKVDQSVSVQGACQTVVACDDASFAVVAIEETLSKTTLGSLRAGDPVNLERAMRMDGRLDGHLVQGHVDTTVTVAGVEQLSTSWLFTLRFDPKFAPYVIPVGSIALDGISLTVARLEGDRLSVAIIPHTWEHTTVRRWTPGARVNAEFDLVGKYVVRHLAARGAGGGLTAERLDALGFGPGN